MGLSRGKSVFIVLFFLTILFASPQLGAMRPLEGEEWREKARLLVLSLQKGTVRPPGPNPCTHIPRGGKGTQGINGTSIIT
ncbi:hypothetical protein I3842_03G249000 [Carya illinoinensis]|uniref:Transmembrane protein n=1 Tax=Carya illinoinensis TaxID=32201 RepID=A0A922FPL7_CARIL|nr:hypothetical protein I3842_03G249000 [Carya illinoinensis]